MRRALAVVAAVVASSAYAQGVTPGGAGIGPAGPGVGPVGTSAVKARYRFDRTGVEIPESIGGMSAANVVTHLVWNGTALVDRKGVAFTQVGTVPQVATGPWYPNGFTGSPKPGAGPFSTSNYYKTTATDDVGDITGNFVICVVYDVTTAGTTQLAHDGLTGGDGWSLSLTSTQTVFATFDGGVATTSTHTGGGAVGHHVACAGRAATNQYAKADLASLTTTAGTKAKADTTKALTLGVYNAASGDFTGTIREAIIWSGEAFTDAKATAVQKHVFGMYGNRGVAAEPLTFTRATTATCELPDEGGTVYTIPAGVPCINAKGLRVEPARTNYALNSATNPKTTEASAALSAGAHVAWHTGAGTMTIEAGTATVTGLSCTAVAAGTVCPFTVTVGGTMAITTSGAATHVQIEAGAYRTSAIVTTTAAVARNADAASVVNALAATNPSAWCVGGTYTPEYGTAWATLPDYAYLYGAPGAGGANTHVLNFVTSGTKRIQMRTWSSPANRAPDVSVAAWTGAQTVHACSSPSRTAVYQSGVLGGSAGGATFASQPATFTPGSQGGSGELGGYIKNFRLCNKGDPKLCK